MHVIKKIDADQVGLMHAATRIGHCALVEPIKNVQQDKHAMEVVLFLDPMMVINQTMLDQMASFQLVIKFKTFRNFLFK